MAGLPEAMVIREGFSEGVTFELAPEGSEGPGHPKFWKENKL